MTSLSAPPSSPQSGKSELDATLARFRRAYSPARLNAGLDRIAADVEAAGVDVEGLRLVLASGVRAHEREALDMTYWVHPRCGTVGCLIGRFCLDHPDDALKLNIVELECGAVVPTFGGKQHFTAIAARFRIPVVTASRLFSSTDDAGDDRSPLIALEQLDQFITDHTPPAPRLADLNGADYAAAAVEAEEDGSDLGDRWDAQN